MIKRLVVSAIAVVMAVLFTVSPVFAYLFYASFSVTEANGTAYTMLPIIQDLPTTWLVDHGYIDADALDTAVLTNKPWMVTDDSLLTATSLAANGQSNMTFTTGNTSATSMDIIAGYDGYVTVTDAAALEPANNFEFEFGDAYVDTSEEGYIETKPDAFYIRSDGAGNIKTAILTTQYSDSAAGTLNMHTGIVRGAQRVDNFPIGVSVVRVGFYMEKLAAATGTGYVRIRKVSDDSIIGTLGTIDVSTIGGGAPAWYYFDDVVTNDATQNVRFTFEHATGNAVNHIRIYNNGAGANVIDGKFAYYNGAWVDGTVNQDCSIWLTYDIVSCEAAVASGEHDIEVTATGGGTNLLGLSIDGGAATTTALAGASVPDNAYDWVLMSNVTPYMGYYKHTVSGTLIAHYQPVDIIAGTVLPDREGAAQNGAFTFGANPAGVTTTLGGMVSAAQSISLGTADSSTGDLLPSAGGSDWNTEPAVGGALLTNPLRPIVVAVSDNTTLTERQVWVLFGIIATVFVTALVGANVRGHHLITGIAASVVIVLMIVWTVFNLWALVVVVLAIFGGLISERSPSL